MRIPVVALLAISAALCPAQDRLADTLRKGIVQEETRQDLNEAIKSYEAVLAQFGQIPKPGASDRKTAATALFRIAECYRKQGRAEQAAAAYRKVLSDFGDQKQLVAKSRAQLGGADAAPDAATARLEYRRLLDRARKTAESERDYVTKQVQLGARSELDLPDVQRKALEKERQLAAFDAGLIRFTPGPPAKSASEARDRYRAILVQEIRLARTAFEAVKTKYNLGVIDSISGAEDTLNDLELELVAFDASQSASKGKR